MDRENWQIQRGPCVVCGATDYPLSMGGPGICPSCDCGTVPANAMQLLRDCRVERDRLRALLNANGIEVPNE